MSMPSKTSISKNTHNTSGNLRVGMLEGLVFIDSSVGGCSFLFQTCKYFDTPPQDAFGKTRETLEIFWPPLKTPSGNLEKPSRYFDPPTRRLWEAFEKLRDNLTHLTHDHPPPHWRVKNNHPLMKGECLVNGNIVRLFLKYKWMLNPEKLVLGSENEQKVLYDVIYPPSHPTTRRRLV